MSPTAPTAPPGAPNHTALVPETPRTDLPQDQQRRDLGHRGRRQPRLHRGHVHLDPEPAPNNTTTYTQSGLASYNLTTGLVDTGFRPTFGTGGVDAVEASPDGTKLFVAGNFSADQGSHQARAWRGSTPPPAPSSRPSPPTPTRAVTEIAATNTTVYIGGIFTTVNGIVRRSLAAVNGTTGAVDTGFVNNLSGGIGVNGALSVQRLKLTRDLSKLLVVHTGRQVNGQDRYGVALINTGTKQLLPWRTRLWEDNLQFVGGIQRAFGADIAPGDEWFAVTSGSGGDRPPINDTVMAFPINGGDDVQPRWISRHFDSVYSIAISEKAVYVGGHMAWAESPTSPDPWPGLDDVGYGTGQGLSGYGLGDAVVNREHLAALNPTDGKALEWNPGSNSYEGNKAMEATTRGLFTGGDATTQGGADVGRIAFFDFNSVPASNGVETAITEPISGRVNPAGQQWLAKGTAQVPSGSIARVELEVIDRENNRYLADNLTTWSTTANTINTTLQSTGARTANWQLPLTVVGNHKLLLRARTVSSTGTADNTKATKKTETFGLTDQPPNTNVTGPSGSVIKTFAFTVTGTATDDLGVNSISMTIRDGSNRYLQDDGTVSSTNNSFRITPDVVGAKSTTWSKEITVPTEGTWKAQARATDTAGQPDLDTADGEWIVSESGIAPSVSISQPAVMVPPTAAQTLTIAPGNPLTFKGSANDDEGLNSVEVRLSNSTTRENLASDGTWGTSAILDWHRISPVNLSGTSYNWTYTTPFNLKPGNYTFEVRATDELGLTTSSSNRGRLNIIAQVPGDAPPDGTLNVTGTVLGGQVLHLDLAGKATDDKGVAGVQVSLRERDTSRYLQSNGTLAAGVRHPPGHPGHPERHRDELDAPGQPPRAGRLGGHGIRGRHGRPAGHLHQRRDRSLPDLPGGHPPGPDDEPAGADRGHHVHRRSDLRQRPGRGRPGDAARRGGHRGLPGPLHELGRHVHQHERELADLLPDQPRHGRVQLLLHDPGRPAGRLHGARSGRGPARPGHQPAGRAPRHRHAPCGQRCAGGEVHHLVRAERVHVRRPDLDRRERALADLLVGLRQRHRQRAVAQAHLHLGRHLHGDAHGDRRVGLRAHRSARR